MWHSALRPPVNRCAVVGPAGCQEHSAYGGLTRVCLMCAHWNAVQALNAAW